MISLDDLKVWLHKKDISFKDKLLITLYSFKDPVQIKDIKRQAKDAGFNIPKTKNVSALLSGTGGLAIRVPLGWEITEPGKSHLQSLGFKESTLGVPNTAIDLRTELSGISSKTTRAFAEEAIMCYELKLYRSAIVMSWLLAIDILHKHVHKTHLSAFNKEAKRVYPRWKNAKTTDDLGNMKESDFLERITSLSIIGKNVKKELIECLDRRSGCGHPNSLRIGPNTVAHHLEILLLNVFSKF